LATAGPISGFIVQPIVGVISDRCQYKLGRRRPFILAGTICCAVGMGIIANAQSIGDLLGDNPNGDHASDHKMSLIFAISGLWIMNLCVNIIQGPARAIIADIVPEDKQQAGNAMVSGVMGLAAVTANIVGAQFFDTSQPYRWLFIIGVVFLLLSCLPTMIVAKEERYTPTEGINEEEKEKTNIIGIFIKIFRGFKNMPNTMVRVTIVYFLSWAAFSPFMIYITSYFGVNVYGGDPQNNHSVYQNGVKTGMYALAIFAAIQWMYSLILPQMIKLIKVIPSYLISQLIATACYILFLFFNQIPIAIVLTSMLSINFTTFNSIPFAVVANAAGKKDAGLYMGVLNSASVVAQTVTNLIAGTIVGWKDQNVAWGIAFGGCISVLACFATFFIHAEEEKKIEEKIPLMSDS